ncbi:hypothetical protein [Kribbella sp. NPDC003557]|uniref:hypothetical protein n=1 Tax=Kribbella sp. NPDC003557 TaxID=3154449 RepID=UPI0033A6B49B
MSEGDGTFPPDASRPRSVTRFFRKRHSLIHSGLLGVAFIASCAALANLARGHGARAISFGSVALVFAVVAAVLAHRDLKRNRRVDVRTSVTWSWRPSTVDAYQATVFIQGILFPKNLNSRIRETVSPLARATQFRTVYTLRLPRAGVREGTFFVPFMVVKKGRLFDDLQVESGEGAGRATLSYGDYLELVSVIFRHLANIDGKRALKRYLGIEKELMTLVAGRAPVDDSGDLVDKLFREMDDGRLVRTRPRELMRAMANILIVHYAIVVKVPVSDVREDEQWEVLSTTERRLLPLHAPEFVDDWIAWLFDRFRRWFGVRPNHFMLPIEKAHLTPSYHLEFLGPPNTYLARQELQHYVPTLSSYMRMRPRLGQRYSHLYLRDATVDALTWKLRLAFFERPPGSFGAAGVTAIAAFCLIFIAGRVASSGATNIPGDVTAIMLSLPVVSSAWIGLERGKVPFGGTTASRISSLASFITSLAAASVYLRAVGSRSWTDESYSLLGAHGVWALLVGAAGLNCFWICYGWFRRSAIYSAMLSKQRNV